MTDMMHKRAMVTGAASGIGLTVARSLARRGCTLVLFDLNHDEIHRIAASLNADGPVAFAASGSVGDEAAVKRAFEIADMELGGLDILINNAGITGNCAALDLDIATWDRTLSVNLTGTFLCAQAAGSRMQASGGVIINISSIYGLVAAPHRVAYSATKAAVVMLTKTLAVEWASAGIRVNCVAPGHVETPGTTALADAGKIDLAALRKRTPQGRLATSEDIAEAVVMLCQDSMAHVTGQVLAVDGGWTAYGYL